MNKYKDCTRMIVKRNSDSAWYARQLGDITIIKSDNCRDYIKYLVMLDNTITTHVTEKELDRHYIIASPLARALYWK